MKKLFLILALVLFVMSCDNGSFSNTLPGKISKTSTIEIYNGTGASVLAKIYYGDRQQEITLEMGHSNFSFESTRDTACLIHYDGRYAEFGSSGVFTVLYGITHTVYFNANVGWIQIKNFTSTPIQFPKFGYSYFMWGADGDYLTDDDSSVSLPDEEQYCKINRSGSEYISFRIGMKNLRLTSMDNGTLRLTHHVFITIAIPVVEI
jgi:hypothetical protein